MAGEADVAHDAADWLTYYGVRPVFEGSVTMFNDDKATKKKDAIGAFDRAIEALS